MSTIKKADETAALEPMETETTEKYRQARRDIAIGAPKYKDTANAPAAIPKATVAGTASVGAGQDDNAGTNPNGSSAFLTNYASAKDPVDTNPLVKFLMPQMHKIAAGSPWETVMRVAKPIGRHVFDWGVPLATGGGSAYALQHEGVPMPTAITEGLSIGALSSPRALRSYWRRAGASLPPTADKMQRFDEAFQLAKNPIKVKMLLGASGLIPTAGEFLGSASQTAKNVQQTTSDIAKKTPAVMEDISKATRDISDVTGETAKQTPGTLEGLSKTMQNLGTFSAGMSSNAPALYGSVTNALAGIKEGPEKIQKGMEEVGKSIRNIGGGEEPKQDPRVSGPIEKPKPLAAQVGDLTTRVGGAADANKEFFANLNKALPYILYGGLGIGAAIAVAKVIESLRARRKRPERKTAALKLNPKGLASKEPGKAHAVVRENPKQVQLGKQIEKEHTASDQKAKAVAADHLVEDPKYYTHLKAMESAVKEKTDVRQAVKSAANSWDAFKPGLLGTRSSLRTLGHLNDNNRPPARGGILAWDPVAKVEQQKQRELQSARNAQVQDPQWQAQVAAAREANRQRWAAEAKAKAEAPNNMAPFMPKIDWNDMGRRALQEGARSGFQRAGISQADIDKVAPQLSQLQPINWRDIGRQAAGPAMDTKPQGQPANVDATQDNMDSYLGDVRTPSDAAFQPAPAQAPAQAQEQRMGIAPPSQYTPEAQMVQRAFEASRQPAQATAPAAPQAAPAVQPAAPQAAPAVQPAAAMPSPASFVPGTAKTSAYTLGKSAAEATPWPALDAGKAPGTWIAPEAPEAPSANSMSMKPPALTGNELSNQTAGIKKMVPPSISRELPVPEETDYQTSAVTGGQQPNVTRKPVDPMTAQNVENQLRLLTDYEGKTGKPQLRSGEYYAYTTRKGDPEGKIRGVLTNIEGLPENIKTRRSEDLPDYMQMAEDARKERMSAALARSPFGKEDPRIYRLGTRAAEGDTGIQGGGSPWPAPGAQQPMYAQTQRKQPQSFGDYLTYIIDKFAPQWGYGYGNPNMVAETNPGLHRTKGSSYNAVGMSHSGNSEGVDELKAEDKDAILAFVKANPNLDDDVFHQFVESRGLDPHDAEEVVYRYVQQQTPDQADVKAAQAFSKGVKAACEAKGLDNRGTYVVGHIMASLVPESAQYTEKLGTADSGATHSDTISAGKPPMTGSAAAGAMSAMGGDDTTAAQRFMVNVAKRKVTQNKSNLKKGIIPHHQDIFGDLGNRLAINSVANQHRTSGTSAPAM